MAIKINITLVMKNLWMRYSFPFHRHLFSSLLYFTINVTGFEYYTLSANSFTF